MKQFNKIYSIVAKIPKGKVMTYKQIAKMAGVKTPRIVGFALHKNYDPKNIPCHRVVKSNGYLADGYAFGGLKRQKEILQSEGIMFNENFVNLDNFQFKN